MFAICQDAEPTGLLGSRSRPSWSPSGALITMWPCGGKKANSAQGEQSPAEGKQTRPDFGTCPHRATNAVAWDDRSDCGIRSSEGGLLNNRVSGDSAIRRCALTAEASPLQASVATALCQIANEAR